MQKKNRKLLIEGALVLVGLGVLYIALDILFALSEQPKDYIKLTKSEESTIQKLSESCDCKVKVRYDYVIRDGIAVPKIDSDSKYSISFTWKEEKKNKSICEQDSSYLNAYALKLFPELSHTMRYIKDYPVISFNFSVEDDTNPINGFSCNKHIVLKR